MADIVKTGEAPDGPISVSIGMDEFVVDGAYATEDANIIEYAEASPFFDVKYDDAEVQIEAEPGVVVPESSFTDFAAQPAEAKAQAFGGKD